MDMETLSAAPLSDATIEDFAAGLRGRVLRPSDEGYDRARRHYNALIDKRPALIVECAGVGDVIDAVAFARTHNVLVSVRGGGHNVAGRALVDGGMVIDLSPMRGIRVDPRRRTVRAEGGVTWGEFDRETQAFGLATTGGLVSTTGIAGFTLGGGLGWLMRRFGLACDNLVSVDLVTADGEFLTASGDERPELFWGLRGAGPNFGIATALEYGLHPVGPVLAGRLVYPFDRAKEVFRVYREMVNAAPDELTAHFGMRIAPDGAPVAGITLCWSGPIEQGEEIIRPLRQVGPPRADLISPMPYRQLQRLVDHLYPSGVCQYWKSSFLGRVDDDALDTIVAHAETIPSPLTSVVIEQLGGAAARVDADQTAFGHRDAAYDILITSLWTDPTESERHIQWTRDFWDAVQPYVSGGTYVNYLDADRPSDAAYDPPIYRRLVALKDTYDPTNFFRMNVNIQPTA